MWWRNPWLRERRLLLSLAIFDGLLIAGTYGLLYLRRFDHWPGMNRSMVGLLILWLGCSYLLGRYSSRGDGRNENSLQRVLITAAVAALVLAIVVVILSWGLWRWYAMRSRGMRLIASWPSPITRSTSLPRATG